MLKEHLAVYDTDSEPDAASVAASAAESADERAGPVHSPVVHSPVVDIDVDDEPWLELDEVDEAKFEVLEVAVSTTLHATIVRLH